MPGVLVIPNMLGINIVLSTSALLRAQLSAKGATAVAHARSIAPVDTGRYQSSITFEVKMEEHDHRKVPTVIVEANAPYSRFVEYGTRDGMQGDHVLRRTLDAMKGSI